MYAFSGIVTVKVVFDHFSQKGGHQHRACGRNCEQNIYFKVTNMLLFRLKKAEM